MKKLPNFFPQFLLGFALAFIVFNLTMCPDKTAGPVDDHGGVEAKELKEFGLKAKNAFTSGSIDSVLAITYDEFAKIYRDELPNDPAKFVKYGEALEKKKLIFGNQFYAEYEVEIEGEKYTIAFGQSGDGQWKIIRF